MRSDLSSWSQTITKLGFRRNRRRNAKRAHALKRRMAIENLEPRQMLAVSTVDSPFDNTTSGDNLTTLREAIAAANANAGADIIEFASSLTESGPATIGLTLGQLTIADDVTIVGPDRDLLTIDAQGNSRVIMVDSGVVATISGLNITGGNSDGGGGIYTFGDLTLDSVRVEGNRSSGNGGGIFVYGTLDLNSSIVNSNDAASAGGGIYVNDSAYATIVDSTIDDNQAYFGAGIFGYLSTGERLVLESSTISNNRAVGDWASGGGLLVQAASTGAVATITNSTISNNTASYSGAIRADGSGIQLVLVNSTIAYNQGNESGGIQSSLGATATLYNTITAENTNWAWTDSDVSGPLDTASSYNLLGRGGSGGITNGTNGNIVLTTGQSAGLAPLGDYGGPTKTHSLLADSPAIDRGGDIATLTAGLLTDQRGEGRYVGTVDIGAFEVSGPIEDPDVDSWTTYAGEHTVGFGPAWDLPNDDRLYFDSWSFGEETVVRWARSDGFLVDYDDYETTSSADETASRIYDLGDGTNYSRVDKYGSEFYYQRFDNDLYAVLVSSLDRNRVGYSYEYDVPYYSADPIITSVSLVRPGQNPETWTYGYDVYGYVETITDPFGRIANITCDGAGVHEIILPAPDSSEPGTRPTFTFSSNNTGIPSVTDADGRTTELSFAAYGGIVVASPDGGERTLTPAFEDISNTWRHQLGAWANVLPEFKYKVSLYGHVGNKRASEVDELGRITLYDIDPNGNIVKVIDPAHQVTDIVRNDAGLPLEVTITASGDGGVVNHTVYTYDDRNNLTQVDYFDGTAESWDYDDDFSQVIEHVDQLSRTTVYTINPSNGNTTESRQIVGDDDRESSEHDDVVTQYEYEDDGLVKNVVNLRNDVNGDAQLSHVTHYEYTDVDNTSAHIGRWLDSTTYGGDDPDASGIFLINDSTVSIASRNDFGMPTEVEDEVGRVTEYEYDDLDRLTKVTLPDPGDGQPQPVIEYSYTLSGLLEDEVHTSIGSSEQITTHYHYDPNGEVDQIWNDYGGPDEAETIYTRDAAGNITHVTDALGHTTRFVYDVLNRPIAITEEDPDGIGPLAAPVTLLIYDALGRVVGERDPEKSIWQWQYDDLARTVMQLDPEGGETTSVYNAARQLSSVTDPEERVTTYDYDGAGRLMSAQHPGEANPTVYQYDSAGNLRFVSDPLGKTSESIYDERFRVTEQIDANNKSTTYSYTDANELETLTDPDLNTTTWGYDGAGRMASETNELDYTRSYQYDAYGRVAEYTDRNGRLTTYDYDNLNYLSAEKWYDDETLERTINYDYDLVGNLLSVSDPYATYEYGYDNLNRQTSVVQTIAGLSSTIEFDHAYDAAGRMISSSATIGSTADYQNGNSLADWSNPKIVRGFEW